MSTTVVTPEVKPKQKADIWEQALLLNVSRKWPSLSKTVKSTDVQVDADKRRIHVTKDLFNSKALKSLFSYDQRIDDFIYRRCTPFPMKRGMYVLAIDLFDEVENELVNHEAGRVPLIDACYEAYDKDLEDAKQALGALFDPTDYIPKERFKQAFAFEWDWVKFGVDERLEKMSKDVAQRQADKMAKKWIEAGEAAEKVLFTSFSELVAHLNDRLSPGTDKDGNPTKKTFRDSLLDNVQDFLKVIKSRNLTGNEELNSLADQARALTSGITPDMLRTNDSMREAVQKGFATIKEQLDRAVVDASARIVRFED